MPYSIPFVVPVQHAIDPAYSALLYVLAGIGVIGLLASVVALVLFAVISNIDFSK